MFANGSGRSSLPARCQNARPITGSTPPSAPTSMGALFLLCCWILPDSLLSQGKHFFENNTVHSVNGYGEGLRGFLIQFGQVSAGDLQAQHIAKEVLDADRKSTRLNSSHANISYAVFCL